MSERLRWGLLGAARIGRTIAARLRELPRHDLVAVASRDPARAAACAADWGVPQVEPDYDALLHRDDIDVVYVALPNALHAEWTIRAVRAGKHVLCEKPLALSVADVDRVADEAARANVRVAEAFAYRHHAQTAKVRQLVAAGDLGPLRVVRGAFSFRLERPGDIRWDPGLGGGALWDIGCYPVSYARLLFDREPTEAFAAVVRAESGVDESAAAVLRFGEDGLATLDCGFRAAFRSHIEVVGTDAALQVPVPFKPGASERLLLVRGDQRVTVEIAGEPPYRGELEDMARQVLDGGPPGLPLADSRGNVATIVALQQSAAEHRPVALDPQRVVTVVGRPS